MTTVAAKLQSVGNDVQAIDLESGRNLLELIPVEGLTLHVTTHDRRLALEVSPWAFAYDIDVKASWTYKGERIQAIIVGDDVVGRTVSVDDIVKEWRNG